MGRHIWHTWSVWDGQKKTKRRDRDRPCPFSRERLRRVLRKKTSAELRLIYIFTSSPQHIHILTYISAHLHIYIHNCTSTSLLIFIFTHLHLCSCSHLHIYISAHLHILTSTSLLIFTSSHIHLCSSSNPHIYSSHLHLSLFLTFSLKAGGSAAGAPRKATLCGDRACRAVRVERTKSRRECDLSPVRCNPLRRSCVSSARNAGESAICPGRGQPICGDRACRVRKMQARVPLGFVRRNPLRRSCASRARNAGESAFWPDPAQPSAEIVRVEGAKCRRECVLARSGETLCGDRACRLCSTTLVCGAGS